MTDRDEKHNPSTNISPEMLSLLSAGIVLIVLLLFHNSIVDYYKEYKNFFYNFSLGMLSWASIQSASLLAIHLHVRSDLARLEDSPKQTVLKNLYEVNKKIFRDYTNALFKGWVISLALAMIALFSIALEPSIPLYWKYFVGVLMLSVFVGLLFLLIFSLIIYRSISNFK